MTHDHAPLREGSRKRLTLCLLLAGGFMLAEVIGGLLSGSLALLADAGHMLSDAGALGLSLFALWYASRPGPASRTYGNHRAEILATLLNAASLIVIAVFIFIEAYHRFSDPPPVQGPLMMSIAVGGLVINVAMLFILHGGHEESLNVRGAWLHVMADTLGSVGAITAAVLIWAFEWNRADPVASVLIGGMILFSSWRLLTEVVNVLMEHAPKHLDPQEIRSAMGEVEGVKNVHDLHVWTITSGLVILTAHVSMESDCPSLELLRRLRDLIRERYEVDHITIQLEPEGYEEDDLTV